jgi:hypothetical protein
MGYKIRLIAQWVNPKNLFKAFVLRVGQQTAHPCEPLFPVCPAMR